MNSDVLVKISALDNTREAFQSVKRSVEALEGNIVAAKGSIESLQPTFEGMTRWGGAAFAALTAALGLSVNEAKEAEAVQFRLAQILRTSTGATDEQIAALNAQADALEKVGVVTGDAITQAQAQLATFDLQAETIEKLTPAILDYVVAEKGAGATTEDLKQMTNGLAQALNGNFASLTRVGFVLDDATKALIENGTEAERAAALVQVLNSTYEGFNVAARSTAEGGMVALRNEFGRLQEIIGKEFLADLEKLTAAIQPVITKIIEWVEANPELAKNIIIATLAVTGLVTAIGAVGLIVPIIISGFLVVGTVIAALASPIGIIIGLLAAIGASFGYIVLNWSENWESIKWATGLAAEFIGEKMAFIGNVIGSMVNAAMETLRNFGNFFIGIGESVANSWVQAINTIIDALNTIQVDIPDWVPGIGGESFGIDIPTVREINIPRLATGGLVTRPTIAEIGEAGPEAVIPLRQMPAFGGITVNITDNSFMGERDMAEKVGDRIISLIKQNQRL
jgi:hypothetical protein